MLSLQAVHHIAIICSDYQKSKAFYTEVLGLEVIAEQYRAERDSYKLDLALAGLYIIELFSFPNPPQRPTHPEATGLRHLAFQVADVAQVIHRFQELEIPIEDIRIDENTGKRFTFSQDPDLLPIEFYEV